MRGIRVWARLLGLRRAVVEDVTTGNEGRGDRVRAAGVRERDGCGICQRRSSLLKAPKNLNDEQAATLRQLKAGGEGWRAYTLKGRCPIFQPSLTVGGVTVLKDRFISKAARAAVSFVRLGQTDHPPTAARTTPLEPVHLRRCGESPFLQVKKRPIPVVAVTGRRTSGRACSQAGGVKRRSSSEDSP